MSGINGLTDLSKLMDFGKLKPREKVFVLGLITAVGFGVYSQVLYKPVSRNISKCSFQIQKSRARLSELKNKSPDINVYRKNIHALNKDCDAAMARIQELEKKLPSKKNVSQLMGEFTRVAKGVKLASIRQKMKTSEEYSRVFVELRFNAPYKEMINYVRAIESISPFLKIEEMDMAYSSREKAGEPPEVRLVVSSLLGEEPFMERLKALEAEADASPARDIFVSKAKPASSEGRKIELKLEGITYNAGSPTAIINGEVVREGSDAGNLKVKKILQESVILTDGAEDHILSVER